MSIVPLLAFPSGFEMTACFHLEGGLCVSLLSTRRSIHVYKWDPNSSFLPPLRDGSSALCRRLHPVWTPRSHGKRNEMRFCAEVSSQARSMLQLFAGWKSKESLHCANRQLYIRIASMSLLTSSALEVVG